MTIKAWKTNFIGLNKPSKVLLGTVDTVISLEPWPYPNDSSDPYWGGGYNPQPYQWEITATVDDKLHGSNLTRVPFIFNALDIEVGDFVAGAQDGKVLQIISIISKGNNTITAVVEDRLRYNTFRDSGLGIFGNPGPVVFFQINELGFPMLDPLPSGVSVDFFGNVASRFQYMNPLTNYLLEKTAHGFEQGDAICIENEQFTLCNANNIGKFIGTVIYPGPGPNEFILRPANGVIDFVPSLPGAVGDYIYPAIDGTGNLTTDDASRRPIFMKIATAITSSTIGTGINPTGTDGDVIDINRVQVALQGAGGGIYTLDEAVTLINDKTSLHKVTAIKVGTPVIVTSNTAGSAYEFVGGYTPFSASINGVVVNFTTSLSGLVAFGVNGIADVNDMISDINNANIENLIASTDGSKLTLTHDIGGAIEIVNLTNDANGKNFAGTNSITNFPLSTPANTTTSALELRRLDGGPVTIVDIIGSFFTDAGVMSGQTGRYALGLNIEQGIRSSLTTMVADIGARDALNPLPGDQAYVVDAGAGEWAIFVWGGNSWLKYNNQRSENTDARTLVKTLDLITSTAGQYSMGTVSTGRKIIDVSVEVTNGARAVANDAISTISVGTTAEPELFTTAYDSVLLGNATYHATTNYVTNDYTDVSITLNKVAGASGTITVKLTYV